MPNQNTTVIGDAERVYRSIKAQAVACRFSPGKPIRVTPLAMQLGVSSTPIRAALNMLVAEGLVLRVPQKGFRAMSISADRFRDLYSLNQFLLEAALTEKPPTAQSLATAVDIATEIRHRLDDDRACTPDAVATCTGELFLSIAGLSGNAQVVDTVARINDGLSFVRSLDCRDNDSARAELMTICELLLTEQTDAVAKLLAEYHETRMATVPELINDFRA